MRFISKNLILALAVGAFGFTATSGWASLTPAAQTQNRPAMQSSQTHSKKQSATESISGTIVKSGNSYVLRASTGQEYQLSNASRAKSYVGKTVTVTGKVNASSHLIDVQSIQPQ